jgi:serine/threonine protein kinase
MDFHSYLSKKKYGSIVSDYHTVHLQVVNRKNHGYGLPADIWSLGCTVLEMLTREIPYSDWECVRVMFFFFYFLLRDVYCYDDGYVVYVL